MRAFRPRIRSASPTGELIQRMASAPKRALNFAHPVCGVSLTSRTAGPYRETAAHREVADAKGPIRRKADRRRGASAIGPARSRASTRVVATVIWAAIETGVAGWTRAAQLSPTSPPSRSR